MHDGELQVGNSVAGPNPNAVSDRLGLDPLLAQLDGVAAGASEISSGSSGSSGTFLLMLDAKTSLRELYPLLVEQLDTLRQRGYLSHWDGQGVVERPVTVVIAGEETPDNGCVDHSYSDIFLSDSPEAGVSTTDFTREGLRHLSPVCAV
jgi:hypothetical protein